MKPFTYDHTLRVRYGETDQMGIVWHGNYLLYFEEARTEAMRAAGLSYHALEEEGVMMPLVSAGMEYHRPARYDDILRIRVTVREPPTARMRFEYEVLDEAGETLVTGFTVLAFMRADNHRPCRPPMSLRALFARLSETP